MDGIVEMVDLVVLPELLQQIHLDKSIESVGFDGLERLDRFDGLD